MRNLKKYVFLTPAIGNMGGSQMYVRNKIIFLKKNGWDVSVFYFQYFNIIIDELQEYESGYIFDLRYGIQYMTASKRKKVLSNLQHEIGDYSEIIIESNMFRLSYWAELLANFIGARHILAPLEEEVPVLTDDFVDYFVFKLKRREILNSSEESLKRFLRAKYKKEYSNYSFSMEISCSNVISRDDVQPLMLAKSDYTIMSIGRLEKPYIIPMFAELKEFAQHYLDKIINIVVIGASPNGDKEKEISYMFETVPNVKIYFLGFVYPIPSSYFDHIDVSLACANSVLVTANLGIPSISIDWNDYNAIGVYGQGTQNIFHRTNEPVIKISKMLEDVLVKKKYERINTNDAFSNADNVFQSQLLFLEQCDKTMAFYDTTKLYTWNEFLISNMKRIIHEILRN